MNHFIGPKLKIERAKKHISNLNKIVEAWSQRKPHKIIPDFDSRTNEDVFRIEILESVPGECAMIIGDAVHNLRSALDHLACELVRINGGQINRSTGFPIGKSAKDFETIRLRKVKGAAQIAHNLIREAKPYKGGNEPWWLIHEFDRFDKHQTLVIVAAAHKRAEFIARSRVTGEIIPSMCGRCPPKRLRILKDGEEILRRPNTRIDSDVHYEAKFTYVIAFDEPDIIEVRSVLPTLRQMIDGVECLIKIFEVTMFSS